MIRLFRSAVAAIRVTVLGLVILAGIVTAGAQLAAPLLGGFRADVERWLESTLRTPVRIESLAVRWRSHGPQLVARNVAVLDLAGQPAVELAELRIAVALGDVLRDWRLRPSRIGIAGVRLQIVRKTDGSLGIRGIRTATAERPVVGDTADSTTAALLLLLPERLTISGAEVTLEDRMRGRPPLTFRNASLTVHNEQDRHWIDATLELSEAYGSRVRLAGALTAAPETLDDWQADLFVETEGAELAALLSHLLPARYRLDGARTDLRWWSHWDGGEPAWIEGRTTVRGAALSGIVAGKGLRIDAATGAFRWDRRPDGWTLRVTDFALHRPDGQTLTGSEWGLGWRRAGRDGGPALRLVANQVAVDAIAAVLAVRPPADEQLSRLLEAQPRGTLRELDVRAARRQTGAWWWSAAGKLDGGALMGSGAIPGIENLALDFAAGADGGRVTLTTQGAQVRSADIFRHPVAIDELGGTVSWTALGGGGWRVQGSSLRLGTAGTRLDSRFRLDLTPSGSGVIDLEARLGPVPLDQSLALLPVGVMDQRLVSWLDRALHGGRITSGTCVLAGPLADFPFEERRTGRFEVQLGVADATLAYAPGWPDLREIDARVRIHGFTVDVEADRARIYDSRVVKAKARVDAPPGSPVEVEGTIDGPIGDHLRLLRETPLSADFGDLARHLQGSGNLKVDLDLAVPFAGTPKERERLEGTLSFAGNELRLAGWPLPLESLHGRVGFDLRGLRGKAIEGQLLGSPTIIDVQTGKTGVTTITAGLRRLDVRALDPLTGGALTHLRGAAAVKATVDVPPLGTKGKLILRLESDLKGVNSDLPVPLDKAAETARPLAIELGFPPDGPIAATARLGGDLDLAAELDASTGLPLRAGLMLGGGRAELPRGNRSALRGRLATLDLAGWLDLIGARPDGRPSRPPLDFELTADRLLLGDTTLTSARVTARELPDAWLAEVRATELEGSLRYPRRSDQEPATFALDRLALRADPTAPAIAPRASTGSKVAQDPRELPAVVVDVRRLQLNGQELGTARMVASRVEKGLQLRELTIDGPAGRLRGGGDWLMTGGGPRTSLNFALDTPDLGHLIIVLGFADSIDRGPARLNGELSWPGPPVDGGRGSVSGRIDLDMGAGRFLDIDPGVGRVMGLLNVAAIQRRLSLDFSDLFRKGLGFDAVTGHFSLETGTVRTEDLRIRGPSGIIEIAGRTNVVAQEFDQVVTVTPSLGSTLPIAGAVVGGPVVGAAMLVVQGLVGKQVDQIGAVRYAVKGPWSDPDIEVVAGRPLRQAIQGAATPAGTGSDATLDNKQPPAPVEGRATGDAAPAGALSETPAPTPFRLPDLH